MTHEHPGAAPPSGDIARTLAVVARSLQAQPDHQHTVEGIIQAVSNTVPGVEDAGVSLRVGTKLHTVAATSERVQRLTQIEHDLREGPCVQAELDHRSYRIDEMTREARWPRFAAAAIMAGIQSMLGFQLFISNRSLGTLDLYSTKPNAFDDNAELIGELFAAHAAIAVIGSAERAQWKTALNSRDVIGMAKGILMNREHLTATQAFELLVKTSQKANIKIQDLSAWLVDEANEKGS